MTIWDSPRRTRAGTPQGCGRSASADGHHLSDLKSIRITSFLVYPENLRPDPIAQRINRGGVRDESHRVANPQIHAIADADPAVRVHLCDHHHVVADGRGDQQMITGEFDAAHRRRGRPVIAHRFAGEVGGPDQQYTVAGRGAAHRHHAEYAARHITFGGGG